jgi:hypothetical protein
VVAGPPGLRLVLRLESLESSEVMRTVAFETVDRWTRSLLPTALVVIGLITFISGDLRGTIGFVLKAAGSLGRQS